MSVKERIVCVVYAGSVLLEGAECVFFFVLVGSTPVKRIEDLFLSSFC